MVNGSAVSSASAKQSATGQIHHQIPFFYIIGGCVLLAVWLLANAIQIQTSEAWMNSKFFSISVIGGFSVYGQLIQLFSSTNSPVQIVAYMFAWAVQLAYMVMAVEVKLHKSHVVKALWCGIVLLIVLNSIGDVNYAATAGYSLWGQVGFAGAMFVSSLGFGLFGASMIAKGVAAYRA